MIVKASELKKLMKEAWKIGVLVVSRDKDDLLLIQGTCWVFVSDVSRLTNEAKAAVVELGGEFPDKGSTFRCGKDQMTQYEFEQTIFWDPARKALEAEAPHEAYITRVILESNSGRYMRLVEMPDSARIYIRDGIMDIISDKDLIVNSDEPGASGPFGIGGHGLIYWTNWEGAFLVWQIPGSERSEESQKFASTVTDYEYR